MPNLSSILKAEITRLARKEIKNAVDPLRKTNGAHRREIAELKRRLASLQRDLKASRKPARERNSDGDRVSQTRFTASGLKALRARLGLSAANFGLLVGVSGQSVYNWEVGKAVPRANQQLVLATVRRLGKREAARRLEAMG